MAETLAIVGLASSIISFVDAAQKVISRLKDYWESGRELPKAYANVRNQLAFMVPEVEEMKNEYHRGLIPADKAVGLHDAIEACNRQTARLNAILDDVLPTADDSKLRRGRKALRSLRREKEVAGIQSCIESSKSTFTLYYVRHPVSLPIRPKISWLERCCDIPATSILHFFGREDVLQQIDEIFGVGSASCCDTMLNQPRRAVLIGMGGQGKTQTALRYCRKAFQNRTFNTVLWIDASSETSAHQAINSILSKAEIPKSAQGFEQNLSAFKDALTSLKGPCLLVFDNYDTPRDFSRIAEMFVQHEQICILLTSRHHESLRLGTPIHVRDMDQGDAEDLLLVSSGLMRNDVDPKHLATTVNMLGCLPLALDQAGAYIRRLQLSLDLFKKHYMDKQKKILQYTPDLFEYRKSLLPGSEPSVLSVFTTWELSLEQLVDDRPHLEHLLTLSAFFDHNNVHEALFSTRCTLNFTACSGVKDGWLQCLLTDAAWDSYRFQDIIANLHGLSLLQRFWIEDGHIVFSLHPLVNDWLRTRIREKDRASMIVEAAVTVAGMDGSPSWSPHQWNCFKDLSDCAHTLFNDCVDMNPPRITVSSAPVAKSVIKEANPEPHYWRAEPLCCPHGRPRPPVPSTTQLKWIVSWCWYMSDKSFPMTQKQSRRSKRDLSRLLPFGIMWQDLVTVIERACRPSQPLHQDFYRYVEEFRDQFGQFLENVISSLERDTLSEEIDTSSLESDTLSEEIATLYQKAEKSLSQSKLDSKKASIDVQQVEEKGVDVSFHPNLNKELADLNDLVMLLTQFAESGNLALIRDKFRSLPFLQNGF